MSPWIWLLLALVFAIVEVTNLAFFAGFASLGALAAAVAAAAGGGLPAEVAVFGVVSVGGVAVLRRPLMRALGPGHTRALRSGVSGLVGLEGTVVSRVEGTTSPGSVHVRGEDWPAISYDDLPCEPGQTVAILDIDRTRLVVTAS